MDDLAAKLMDLLANKESMDNIKSLSNIINSDLENSEEKTSSKSPGESAFSSKEDVKNDIIPIDAIQTIMKLMPILSSINREDDSTRLLSAVRPLLSTKRQEKLDESMKLMQVFKVFPVLKSQGIF